MLNGEMRKEIVTVKGLAGYLHCHPSTIYRLVKSGNIPAFRLVGGWRFKIGDVDHWCRRAAVKSAAHVRGLLCRTKPSGVVLGC